MRCCARPTTRQCGRQSFAALQLFASDRKRIDAFLPRLCALFETRAEAASAAVAEAAAADDAEARSAAEQQQRTLHHIEGTVLLQCEFAMKHNQALAQRFQALVRADAVALASPFAIALLLSTSGVPRFERDAFKEAFRAVERACSAAVQLDALPPASAEHTLAAIAALAPVAADVHTAVSGIATPAGVPRALLAAVEHAANGWDHVVVALERLGESLCVPRRKLPARVAALISSVGRALLAALFEKRPASRAAIVQFVVGRLLTCGASNDHGAAAHYCVRLLHTLARRAPQVLSEHARALRDALEVCYLFDF